MKGFFLSLGERSISFGISLAMKDNPYSYIYADYHLLCLCYFQVIIRAMPDCRMCYSTLLYSKNK